MSVADLISADQEDGCELLTTWIAAVVPLATALFASPIAAAEPQVTFAVRDGQVEVTVTHDDQPIAEAQVYAADRHQFADVGNRA